MARQRPRLKLADYVIILLSPALIMALIGSLVFFLLEVFYAERHRGAMQWVLFFFVFASVLIGRIALMGEIAGRAHLYSLALGVVAWIALSSMVQYPPASPASPLRSFFNLGLILLIWWCAQKLTWDCTSIDDDTEMDSQGLLQAAGIETLPESLIEEKPEKPGETWWQRLHRHRAERKKKRTPGVWVVIFSLAALPLFGLGQALIPIRDVERRQAAFWLLVVYVASGLGLLLTTSFLGLRKYLRQRKLDMPTAMTRVWLTTGTLVIVALLIGAALLPRPAAEFSWLNAWMAEAPDSQDSARASGRDGQARGERASHAEKTRGTDIDPNAKGTRTGGSPSPDNPDATDEPSSLTPWQSLHNLFEWLGPILKWLTWIVLALLVLILLLRQGLRFLAPFTAWARQLLDWFRSLWASLFGEAAAPEDEEEETAQKARESPSFAFYGNPFDDGRAERMAASELLRFSFAALEAWAREREFSRTPDETPLEFAERLGRIVPGLKEATRKLAVLLGRALYGQGQLAPGPTREIAREFWLQLEQAHMEEMASTSDAEEAP